MPLASSSAPLPSLTPLRGIAALTVVLLHIHLGPFQRAYMAVDLFFVLSGFVLAHVYHREFDQSLSLRRVGRFLWARLARIYPMHLFTTLLAVLTYVEPQPLAWQAIVGAVLLIRVPFMPSLHLIPFAWSVSAEWNAYLVFPFVVRFLMRGPAVAAMALAAALVLLLNIAVIAWFGGTIDIGGDWLALLRALPQVALGILAYRLYRSGAGSKWMRSDLAFLQVGTAIVVALAVGSDGLTVSLFPPLLLVAVSNDGVLGRALNAAPFVWLGDISYSLYLWQTFAIRFGANAAPWVGPTIGFLGVQLMTLAVALVFADFLHRRVELPCRAMMRRLAAPGGDPALPAAAPRIGSEAR